MTSEQWILVTGGNHRCENCGKFVRKAWNYFIRPATYTHSLCEPCVEDLLSSDERQSCTH
jgi:hypothetical protein